MKRLFYLMLVVLGTMAFASCSDDNDNKGGNDGNGGGNGTIIMVTEAEEIDFYVYTFNEGDVVTIDWGDGTVKSYKSIKRGSDDDIYYEMGLDDVYVYTDSKSRHTITIQCERGIEGFSGSGNQVISLDVTNCAELLDLWCEDNMLTSLDVTKNTTLTFLACSENPLGSLDITKNTALIQLVCEGNQLTSLDVSKNGVLYYLYCSDNQFTAAEMNKIYEALPRVDEGVGAELSCDELGDPSIAEEKGWDVY